MIDIGSAAYLIGFGLAALVFGGLVVTAPFEWLVVLSIAAIVGADTIFPSSSGFYSYARFAPLGLVAVRALMFASAKSVRGRVMIPRRFLRPMVVLLAYISVDEFRDTDLRLGALRAVSMALVIVGYGVGVPAYVANGGSLQRLLRTVTAFMTLVVIAGLVSLPIVTTSTITQNGETRAQGIFDNPNTFGELAMLTFFLLMASSRCGAGRARVTRLCMALMVVAVLVSGSRACLLGMAAGFLMLALVRSLGNKWDVAALVGVPTGIYLATAFAPAFLRAGTDGRTELWHRALHIGMASPWFGVGMGGVDNVLDNPIVDPLSVLVGATESSNEYLRLFVAIGIVGAVLAISALLALVIPAIKTSWQLPATSPLAPLVAALVAMMINEIFEDGLFAFGDSSAILFWFIFFMVAYAVHQTRASSPPVAARQPVSQLTPSTMAYARHALFDPQRPDAV
jgi:hypothetical protein